MAATTTYVNAAQGASDRTITLNAYTAPSGRAKALVKVDDEIMLITDTTNAPTLGVVRGYMGTAAAAHKLYAAAVYGAPGDMQTYKGPTVGYASVPNAFEPENVQEVTITGATGTTAAPITAQAPAFLNVTGTSGAGLNLPYPQPGWSYTIRNGTTGVCKIYSVGATINGTTGTTAVSLTATGNLTAVAKCSTAGAWYVLLST